MKPELGYLKNVNRAIMDAMQRVAGVLRDPKDDGLKSASEEMRSMVGALNLARFEGVALVVREWVVALENTGGGKKELLLGILGELRQYVIDLLAETPDVPLRLWPAYKNLCQLNGRQPHPSELFFAPIEQSVWDEIVIGFSENLWDDLCAKLNLAAEEAVDEALEKMSRMVSGLERGFVETCRAHLKIEVKDENLGMHKENRSQAIASLKAIGRGTAVDIGVWRKMLFEVSLVDVTENVLVNEVKKNHQLDNYVELTRQEMARKGKILEDESVVKVKEGWATLKESWVKYKESWCKIEVVEAAHATLMRRLEWFKHPALIGLGEATGALFAAVKGKRGLPDSDVDVAITSLLLLIEEIVDLKRKMLVALELRALEKVKHIADFLATGTKKEEETALVVEARGEFTKQSARLVHRQILGEARKELELVEAALQDWFDQPEAEEKEHVARTAKPLKRIVPILKMARFGDAADTMHDVLSQLDLLFAKSGAYQNNEDKKALSSSIAKLALYFDAEISGQDNPLAIIGKGRSPHALAQVIKKEDVGDRLVQDTKPTIAELVEHALIATAEVGGEERNDGSWKLAGELAVQEDGLTPVKDENVAVSAVIKESVVVEVELSQEREMLVLEGEDVYDSGDDEPGGESMLDLYIEDFETQLDAMKKASFTLSSDPTNVEALTDVRRGFHTLKGSGRMVPGLLALPNIAEKVETFLKRWIAEGRPATEQLLEAIDDAVNAFDGWKVELEKNKRVWVHAAALNEKFSQSAYPEYQTQKESVEIWQGENHKEGVQEEVRGSAVAVDHVFVGSLMVEKNLYDMYLAEAGEGVENIQKEWTNALASKGEVQVTKAFMGYAHKLGSSSRTVGVTQIAELGYLLERWSEKRLAMNKWISQQEQKDAQAIVCHLVDLFECVRDRRPLRLDMSLVSMMENHVDARGEQPTQEQPSWLAKAGPAGMRTEELKKLSDMLNKEIESTRSHLAGLESMRLLVECAMENQNE
jgi:HPt (histidine-containing phosphotransfer) domain-containing protein